MVNEFNTHLWGNILEICESMIHLSDWAMYGFANFGSEVAGSSFVLDVIEDVQMRMHFWEVPTFLLIFCALACFNVLLKYDEYHCEMEVGFC